MPKRNTTKLVGAGQRVYGRLSADVAREIARALQAEQRHTGMTRADLARLVGRDRSFVTRKLSGSQNMEIRTVAALLGALGYELDVKAHRIDAPPGTVSNSIEGALPTVRVTSSGPSSPMTLSTKPAELVVGKSSAFAQ